MIAGWSDGGLVAYTHSRSKRSDFIPLPCTTIYRKATSNSQLQVPQAHKVTQNDQNSKSYSSVERIYAKHATSHLSMERNYSEPHMADTSQQRTSTTILKVPTISPSTYCIHYKKQKNFKEKQKGFRDGLSYSTPQETRGNAITQPRSHPIKKM